jgi:hypothetical protein
MAHQLDQFQDQRDIVLADDVGKLSQARRDVLLQNAILQRYSKDRPREIVSDVSANGSSDLPLPTSSTASFEDGFSTIIKVEYPVGNVPASLLLDEDWEMYRSPSGLQIRILATTPASGDTIRVTWTARHLNDGSTVADSDFEAVCDYAAALCCQTLASIYTQTGDPTIQADSVNYRTKNQEYASLGKALEKRYFDHVGVPENPTGAEVGPAISIGSVHDDLLGMHIDRMTHPRSTR